MAELGVDYIERMREALVGFYRQAGDFLRSQGPLPTSTSQANQEMATAPRPESITTALGLATQLLEASSEHVTAFVKTVTEPVDTIACWTCVRSMLESSALAAWLMDPGIDAKERVSRVFALRYEGMKQHLKFFRFAKAPSADIQFVEDRIDKVEQHAILAGYVRVTNKKGDRIGIGQRMPSATEIIGAQLNEEWAYRLLSAVAHGHSWAINSLGFQQAVQQDDLVIGAAKTTRFEKTANMKGFALLGIRAAKALGLPLWNRCRYCGWDQPGLVGLLESVFDQLQANPDVRFWR